MKKVLIIAISLVSLLLIGCEPDVDVNTSTNTDDNEKTTDTDTTQVFTKSLDIIWNGSSATVSGEVEGVSVTGNSNGYVVITSTTQGVSYSLSGNGNGQFKLYSDYKYELQLNGLTLSCSDGAAINSQCKKKGFVILNDANTLTDGTSYASSDEDQKAAFFSEGQLLISGTGSLDITGNYKHALASDDYIKISSGTLTLKANVSDGLHTNDGITINGGTISVVAADEGLQCDSGAIAFNGGTLTVTSVGKGIKAEGDLTISGGKITVICNGSSSSNKIAAWGPGGGNPPGGGGNPGGNPGGGSSGPEGIESKAALTISGGEVYAYATDDAINSGGDLTITGGFVCAHSTSNDGIDANGNCYIKGGTVYAIGASSPEVGIDANSEEQKKLYVSGGTLVAIGGLESGSSLTQTCYSASWSANTWYALYNGSNVALVFKTPASGGTGLVVSTGGTTSLKSGVTPAGTSIWNNTAYTDATVSGGTSVSLSKYSR